VDQTGREDFVLEFDGGVLAGFIGQNTGPSARWRTARTGARFVQEILGKVLHLVAGVGWQNFDDLHECHGSSLFTVILDQSRLCGKR
jgi:hypothetical protein